MTQIKFNKQIANDIFNDRLFREELIVALNELIDIELSKSEDEIDFELIDAYTDALNELYDEKGIARIFWKLQTVEEFTNSITGNKKWKKLSLAMKITLTACALFAFVISANTVTEKVTGYNVIEQVANAVQEFFTSETVVNNTTTTTEPQTDEEESTTKEVTTETTTEVTTEEAEENTTVKPNKQEGTTNVKTQITPQNPNLSQVLSPTTPPTEITTEPTTAEPFTRVDEEATAAPIVIKLTGEFAEEFKKNYTVGEEADFSGLTIIAQYDNGETKQITIDECNIYGFSTVTPANRIVTVEYEDCSFSFLIRVKEAN